MFEDVNDLNDSKKEEKEKEKIKGTVRWFSSEKGYGFIESENEEEDIFFHFSEIIEMPGFRSLTENDEVEFEIEKGDRGLVALNIRLIKGKKPNEDF